MKKKLDFPICPVWVFVDVKHSRVSKSTLNQAATFPSQKRRGDLPVCWRPRNILFLLLSVALRCSDFRQAFCL